MAKITPQKRIEIARAVVEATDRLDNYLMDHIMDKLGDWEFYEALGDDLTDRQYNAACEQVVSQLALKWLASLQKEVK